MFKQVRDFFDAIQPSDGGWDTPTAWDFKNALDGLDAEEEQRLLLTPLSATVQENALSYIISDGFVKNDRYGDNAPWRADFLKLALDEIERLTQDKSQRLAMLTHGDELGQTPFLKTLKHGGNAELFDILTERLRRWEGESNANDWIKSFLVQPLGTFDDSTSLILQQTGNHLRDTGDTANGTLLLRFSDDEDYRLAEYGSLKATIEKMRAPIETWIEENKPYKNETRMRALLDSPDNVTEGGTPLAYAFPGKLFFNLKMSFRLLDLHMELHPEESRQELANDLLSLIARQDNHGNTAMHKTWQRESANDDSIVDDLAPIIAGLDRRLGTPVALELVEQLLRLQNNKGKLPLSILGDERLTEREHYIDAFLLNLRRELGSQEKFVEYATKVIGPVLPGDFDRSLSDYDSKPRPATAPVNQTGAKFRP